MKYVSLHHHSTFSFLDGYALPETHVRRAAELDMSALALTEHGNISSHVQLERAANAEGIKPIFGCELYTGPIEDDRRRQRKNHLTVLAETPDGYKNLLRLVSRGWSEGFYYEPTVSGALLAEHAEGLVVLSGCQGSLLATSLRGGKNVAPEDASLERARRGAQRFKRTLGDSFYLEVQAFPELEAACEINQAYEQLSKELDIPLVATGDVHYTRPNENEMQQILHNVRGGNKQTLEDQARNWGYDVPLSPPVSDRAMYKRLRATGMSHRATLAAISNSAEIAERCTVTLPKMEPLRYPGEQPGPVLWRKWIEDGWYYRKINKLPPARRQQYRDRLKYEMEIIEGKDFLDYFLVVSDLVKFAKDKGIPVGPARGSAAASLVCYLLRITEVDPMLFPNLVFERFIDTTREDLPDVDLDFDDDRRGEIWDYAAAKYGADSVGSIGTFTKYKSKNSLDDVARVYRIPAYEVETVKELLIERSSGDLRASATIEDTVEHFEAAAAVFSKYPDLAKAMRIEGNYRGMGIHAAGLVISSGKLNDACAVYTREDKGTGEKTEVISADKYDSEYLNILKIDALGLSTMGFLRLALDMIGMSLEELYALPLDDPETIRGFQENDVIGIFQFDGRAMRTVNGELKPDNFDEIADVCALARPGPLHNGASAEYIDVKQGKKEAQRFHPLLDDITKHTNYQIVYQEQILRIVMEIGGFDWTHAAYIRKIISRKLGEQEFNRQWERFWQGASERGVDEESARRIWNSCITAGSYAFNNAHTVSYGMIAYWCMWIKRHHPQAFYVAALTKFGEKKKLTGEKKQLELLQDALKHGMRVLPPDVKRSEMDWKAVGKDGLLAGFRQIHGIGETMAEKILEYRATEGVSRWGNLTEIKGVGPKTIAKIQEFVNKEDPFEVLKLHRILEGVRDEIRSGVLGRLPVPTHNSVEVPYARGEDTEVVWIGKIVHRNLRDLFEVHFSRTGETLDPEEVKHPELNEWVVMLGQDEEDLLTITVDRWKYPRFRKALWSLKLDDDVVLIRGVKRGFQSRRAIYVSDLWVIRP
jgi:DNA polymerase III subunit alpha